MQFEILLNTQLRDAAIPMNYQYPLSAAIYKILKQADVEYAGFLHDTGYRQSDHSLKSFKLFTFSDIKTPFRIQGDRMHMLSHEAKVVVSFHLPRAAETFIKGLFINQALEIADKKSRVKFNIHQVESLPASLSNELFQEITLRPISPIVSGRPNERGNYDFLSPVDPEFISQLMYNWRSKYQTLHDNAEEAFASAGMEVLLYKNPPRSRLVTIKANTPAETKIRGFMNFRLRVRGRKEALELLLNSGVGVYNSVIGGGCVEVIVDNENIKK